MTPESLGSNVGAFVADGMPVKLAKGTLVFTVDPERTFEREYTPKGGTPKTVRFNAQAGSRFGGVPFAGKTVSLYVADRAESAPSGVREVK